MDSSNYEYSQLAALGRYFDTHPARPQPPLPAPAETPADPQDTAELVGADETPNAEYSQLAALGRYFQQHPATEASSRG